MRLLEHPRFSGLPAGRERLPASGPADLDAGREVVLVEEQVAQQLTPPGAVPGSSEDPAEQPAVELTEPSGPRGTPAEHLVGNSTEPTRFRSDHEQRDRSVRTPRPVR